MRFARRVQGEHVALIVPLATVQMFDLASIEAKNQIGILVRVFGQTGVPPIAILRQNQIAQPDLRAFDSEVVSRQEFHMSHDSS
jgi:rRNA processing protein Gar1